MRLAWPRLSDYGDAGGGERSTAIAILGINILGDTVNAVVAHDWRTLIGLPIGGAMIIYLLHFLGRDRIPGPADRN